MYDVVLCFFQICCWRGARYNSGTMIDTMRGSAEIEVGSCSGV